MNDTCTRHDCPGAPRCSSGATVWHDKAVACWTNDELRGWVDATAEPPYPTSMARLEVIRLLREQSYVVVDKPRDTQPAWAAWDPQTAAAARAILDTPVGELAAMVAMSDTVMGNWRTIAATVTQR